MSFDVVRFCEDYGIPHWTEGKNVSPTGHYVNVQCPFCDDRSNHLGIPVIDRKKPTCWKCGSHSLYNVVTTLAPGIPYKQIKSTYSTIITLYNPFPEQEKNRSNSEGKNLKIPGKRGLTGLYKKYIEGRNYAVDYISLKYNLHEGGSAGSQKFRVISPIYFDNKIVSYQGRTILPSAYCDKNNIVRYKACNIENELIHHKYILYNLDNCKLDTILIVEGVPSVWRIGDNCAATFGTGLSNAQINLVIQRYNKIFLLFDPEYDAQKKAENVAMMVSSIPGKELILLQDDSVEDPGEMTEDDVINLKRELHIL